MTGAMAGSGYQLIAPSRFGYLRSTMPDNLTTAMQADAYAQLLDLLGIDKVVVVGISAGAWSSLQFAIPSSGTLPGAGAPRPRRLLAGRDVHPWRRRRQRDDQIRFRRLGSLETHADNAWRNDPDDARHRRRRCARR